MRPSEQARPPGRAWRFWRMDASGRRLVPLWLNMPPLANTPAPLAHMFGLRGRFREVHRAIREDHARNPPESMHAKDPVAHLLNRRASLGNSKRSRPLRSSRPSVPKGALGAAAA